MYITDFADRIVYLSHKIKSFQHTLRRKKMKKKTIGTKKLTFLLGHLSKRSILIFVKEFQKVTNLSKYPKNTDITLPSTSLSCYP